MENEKGQSQAMIIGIVIIVIIAGAGAYYVMGGFGGQEPEGENITVGYSPFFQAMSWHVWKRRSAQMFAEDRGINFIWSDPDMDPTSQSNQVQSMIAQGADVIAMNPVASSIPSIVKNAKNNNVPIVTSDTDLQDKYVSINISFGNRESLRRLSNILVDHMENKFGEPKGLVFNLQLNMTNTVGQQRNAGVHDILDQYENITVVDVRTESRPELALNNTINAIERYGKPDAIISANGGNAQAAWNALEQKGMDAKVGETGHIIFYTQDGFPTNLEMVREGQLDGGLAQPVGSYGALQIYFAEKLAKGEELPEIGTTLTGENIPLGELGGVHDGVNPWKYNAWAPATMETQFGHLHLRTSSVYYDNSNVDSNLLWGNTAKQFVD